MMVVVPNYGPSEKQDERWMIRSWCEKDKNEMKDLVTYLLTKDNVLPNKADQ